MSAKSEWSVQNTSRLVIVRPVYNIITCLSQEDVFIMPASVLRDLKDISNPFEGGGSVKPFPSVADGQSAKWPRTHPIEGQNTTRLQVDGNRTDEQSLARGITCWAWRALPCDDT